MVFISALAGATVLVRWDTFTLLGAVHIPKAKKYMSKQKDTLVICRTSQSSFHALISAFVENIVLVRSVVMNLRTHRQGFGSSV